MENQKPKTKPIFKILINTAKALVVVLALGGIVMLATGTNFDDLTKIFGSRAATASDTLKETWDVAGEVHDIISTETITYIGGQFRSVNGVPRKGLAAIDNLTGEVTDWDPNVTLMGSSGRIMEMAIKDRTIYVVGQFVAVDGVERVGIAAINLDATQSGEYLTSWNPPAKVIGYSLAIKDTTLYMTYYWSNATFVVFGSSGVERYGFMAFDLLAESGDEYYTDWAPNLYDFENDTRFRGRDSFIGREARLLLDGDKLYVYGLSILSHYRENDGTWEGAFNVQDPLFILTTETPESGEYRLDWAPEILSEEQENTRHPDVGNVHSVVLKDNILYISGVFDHVDGQPRQGLAAVRTDTSTPGEYVTGWSPSVDFTIDNLDPDGNVRESSPYSYVGVRAMALSGDELYIGGVWDSIDGVETPSDYDNSGDGLGIRSFAALTTDVSAQGDYLLDWRPDSSVRTSSIYTFEIACNILYAGGYTTRYAPMTAYQLDDEGCDSESAPPPPEENLVVSLDSVEISPSVSTLQAGGHETFVTTAYGSDGEVINDVAYTWAVQGGSTDTTTGDTIVYTASNIAGNYVIQVSATDGNDTVEDTAQVTITVPQLESVILNPSSATLHSGDTVDLTALLVVDIDIEDVVIQSLQWSATGGTLTHSSAQLQNTFTAGNVPGDYTITITASDGLVAKSDTTTVTILAPVPQPQPQPQPEPEPVPVITPTPQPTPTPTPVDPLPESGPEDVWLWMAIISLIGAGLVYKSQFCRPSTLVSCGDINQDEINGEN